jgi:hypothetical protein
VWLAASDDGLYVAAAIEDETHHQEEGVLDMWRGDSLQLGVAGAPPAEAESYEEINLGGNPS